MVFTGITAVKTGKRYGFRYIDNYIILKKSRRTKKSSGIN